MENVNYPVKPKKNDVVICTDDNSDNEDFGMSGIVLEGRKDLVEKREYIIENVISDKDVPSNKNKTWTKEEYQMVRWSWYYVKLKGVSNHTYLLNFNPATHE